MSIYAKQNKTASYDAGLALKNSSGADSLHPFLAGKTVSASLNFPSTSPQTSSDLTVTVVGARVNDTVIVGAPAIAANTSYTGFVSADDTVKVRFNNYSSGSIDPATQTFTVTVVPQA